MDVALPFGLGAALLVAIVLISGTFASADQPSTCPDGTYEFAIVDDPSITEVGVGNRAAEWAGVGVRDGSDHVVYGDVDTPMKNAVPQVVDDSSQNANDPNHCKPHPTSTSSTSTSTTSTSSTSTSTSSTSTSSTTTTTSTTSTTSTTPTTTPTTSTTSSTSTTTTTTPRVSQNPPSPPPSVVFDCGADELVITGADDTAEVDFTITIKAPPAGAGSSWEVMITAAPQPGFEFPPDVNTAWNYNGTVRADCTSTPTTTAAISPPFQLPPGSDPVRFDCVRNELVITGADDTEQVDFIVTINTAPSGEGSNWDVTITAVPQPGLAFPTDATTEWNYTGTVDCAPPLILPGVGFPPVGNPPVFLDCADNELVVTGAADTDTVDYSVNVTSPPAGKGSRWAVTITAKPQPGVVFREGTTTEWNYTGTVDCSRVSVTRNPPISVAQSPLVPVPTRTHPETGSEHVVTLLIGTLLIGAGLAVMRLSRRDDLADAPSG